MIIFRFFALVLLLLASGGPGLWLTRKLRWSPPERLCAAIAGSGVVLYLTSALIYALRLPRFSYFAVSLGCLGFAVAGRTEASRLWASREVRWMVGGFAGLFVWALLLLAMVRSYSGAMWAGDWIEHYQRAQFFLEHRAKDTLFLGGYALPARPPFMNLVAAHFLAQVGERYDLFQVAFVFLNLLAFFPCGLIARLMAPRAGGRAGRIVLFCLFAASPVFLQNGTYAWTKGLANFYVIAGLWFYLRGWRRSDPVRLAAAGVALSGGILVHYSAAPFAGLLLFHYGLFVLPRRAARPRWKFLACLLPGAALLGTWLAWSMASYGARATFGSNSTALAAGAMSAAENLRKVELNLLHSVVPHPLRLSYRSFRDFFVQPSRWGMLRDYFFTIFQTNLIFGLGSLGGLVALFQLGRVARESRSSGGPVGSRFWLGLILAGVTLTVATHPTVDQFGVAQVCSQPLLLLGLTFLAASFGALPRALRFAVAAGCLLDFLAGIFVHFSLQEKAVVLRTVAGRPTIALTSGLLTSTAVMNSIAKIQLGYVFWGDHFAEHLPFLQFPALVLFGLVFWTLLRVALEPRSPGRQAGWRLGSLALLPLAIGAACAAGIRADDREILPEPPGLGACIQAVRQDFDSSNARSNLGVALYREGRIREASAQWTEALLLQPDLPLARYFTQVVAEAYTLPASADLSAAQAVQQDPASAEARFNLAGRLWAQEHSGPARRELEQALRLKPDFPEAKAALRQIAGPQP